MSFKKTDKENGHVMTAEICPPKQISQITWKKSDVFWEFDWFKLRYEFIHWREDWKELSWSTFLKCFFVALVLLALSSIDLGLDIALAYQYIHGTNYIYYFYNISDPMIFEMNCVYLRNSTLSTKFYYSCFAYEETFGIITLLFIFIPGFLFSLFLAYGLRSRPTIAYSWIIIILMPVFVTIFPLLHISLKVSK